MCPLKNTYPKINPEILLRFYPDCLPDRPLVDLSGLGGLDPASAETV
jgi:hypothetical protein